LFDAIFFVHDLNDLHDGRENLTFVHDRESGGGGRRNKRGDDGGREHAHVVMSDILRYPLVVLNYNVCLFCTEFEYFDNL
jgi:hypothetical protein